MVAEKYRPVDNLAFDKLNLSRSREHEQMVPNVENQPSDNMQSRQRKSSAREFANQTPSHPYKEGERLKTLPLCGHKPIGVDITRFHEVCFGWKHQCPIK
jgi:hypothetical protein